METLKDAIELAMDNGYDTPEHDKCLDHVRSIGRVHTVAMYQAYVTQDPLFWQALGKAEVWHKGINPEHEKLYWRAHMHLFIDWIIEGKDIDSFFNELLK